MRLVACFVVSLAAAVVGCGGNSEMTDAEKRVAVAEAANAATSAALAGDGATTCSYMTDRAKKLLLRSDYTPKAETCEEAVESRAARRGRGDRDDTQVFTADDVFLYPVGPHSATVSDDYGGGLAMKEVDGKWLILIPGFVK